jgi:hypothetical protein
VDRGINCNICHGPVNEMHITFKGNAFQMAWCLQCHRAPERYIFKATDEQGADVNAGLTPRQQVFNLYWRLQEHGTSGLTDKEQLLIRGNFNGAEPWEHDKIADGKKLVSEYGIKVQQLSDCSVCHY